METNLYQLWSSSPYNDANLAKKSFSCRLPVHVAARLAAMEEMFPQQSRSEILVAILKLGFQRFEADLPLTQSERMPTEDELADIASVHEGDIRKVRIPVYSGPKADYCKKANKHYVALEKERGTKNPESPFKPA